MNEIESDFCGKLKLTKGDAVAASILVLAENLQRLRVKLTVADDDALAHAICMGLRHGLFGAHAADGSSIHNG